MPPNWAATVRRHRPVGLVDGVRESEPTNGEKAFLVLVVDDVDDNRDLYSEYLNHAGLRVVQACDGEEAIEVVAVSRPDVIIMDLAMPRMDGWEATRLIKADPTTKHIPILVLTGFASSHDLQRAKDAGADDLCTKPCVPKDLLERLQKLIEARVDPASK